jgi:hypothetical protein
MVRLWKVQSGGQPVWRVSLEDPHTGERKSFASLESLLAFFDEETKDSAGPSTPTKGEKSDDG